MAGIDVKLTIDDEAFQRYMRQAAGRAQNLSPFFRQASMIMYRSFALNFKREGRPKRWARLRPNTVAGRRKGSKRILQDKGMLRMSVISRAAPDNVYQMGRDYLKMGTKSKIASFHQEGTPPYDIVPKNKSFLRFMTTSGYVFSKLVHHPGLPARPLVMIQDEDAKDITELAGEHVVGD